MASYTNAGARELASLVVDLDLSTASGLPRVTVPHLADVARLAYQLDWFSFVPRLLSDRSFYVAS